MPNKNITKTSMLVCATWWAIRTLCGGCCVFAKTARIFLRVVESIFVKNLFTFVRFLINIIKAGNKFLFYYLIKKSFAVGMHNLERGRNVISFKYAIINYEKNNIILQWHGTRKLLYIRWMESKTKKSAQLWFWSGFPSIFFLNNQSEHHILTQILVRRMFFLLFSNFII